MKQIHKTKKDNAELQEIKKSTEINQENRRVQNIFCTLFTFLRLKKIIAYDTLKT